MPGQAGVVGWKGVGSSVVREYVVVEVTVSEWEEEEDIGHSELHLKETLT